MASLAHILDAILVASRVPSGIKKATAFRVVLETARRIELPSAAVRAAPAPVIENVSPSLVTKCETPAIDKVVHTSVVQVVQVPPVKNPQSQIIEKIVETPQIQTVQGPRTFESLGTAPVCHVEPVGIVKKGGFGGHLSPPHRFQCSWRHPWSMHLLWWWSPWSNTSLQRVPCPVQRRLPWSSILLLLSP